MTDSATSIDADFGARRPREARSANASAVLRYLFAQKPTSRADIASGIGLTKGPVTRIVALLLELGLVREQDPEPVLSGKGRPRVPVAIDPDAGHVVSVHVGSMHTSVARVNLSGEMLTEVRAEHDGRVDGIVDDIVRLSRDVVALHHAPVLGIGVIVGGWVDSPRGVVRRHDGLEWDDVPLARLLNEALGTPVHLESAVRAHAMADMVFGHVPGRSDFVHVFIGNVIEVASVFDGRVRSGPGGYGGDLADWLMRAPDGGVRRAVDAISDFVVRDRARGEGVLPTDGTFEELVTLAAGEGDRAGRAGELLRERAVASADLVAQVAGASAAQSVVVSSGAVATADARRALIDRYEELMSGVPHPTIRAQRDWRTSLATAAASVVIERELLLNPLRAARSADIGMSN